MLDGVIDDPLTCPFTPQSLLCKAGQDPSTCLTAAQVEAVEKVYEGPRNPITGAEIYPGLQRGTELGWGANTVGPAIASTAAQFFAFMVYNNPSWNYETFNFSSDVAFADNGFSFLIDAISPDLSAFQARGGKILQSHLWSSVVHPATRSIEYYDQVVMNNEHSNRQVLNANKFHETQDFYRLFHAEPGSAGSLRTRYIRFDALSRAMGRARNSAKLDPGVALHERRRRSREAAVPVSGLRGLQG